jgi:hypothetical protein
LSRGAAVAAALAVSCVPDRGPLMMPGEDCLECHGGGALPGEPATIAAPESARRWTIAGTVFAVRDGPPDGGLRGAAVHVRDASGRAFTLRTNRAGNFYTAEPVDFPLRVRVEHAGAVHAMERDVPYGGCNGCHRLPPRQEAPGRVSVGGDASEAGTGPLMMPGESCLECHGGILLAGEPPTVSAPRPAPPWTVAGTVFSSPDAATTGGVEGASVHLTDADGQALTLVTNRAGNFFTGASLRFPLRAAVEYQGAVATMERDVPYGGCNGCHRLPPRQEAPGRLSATGGDGGGDAAPSSAGRPGSPGTGCQ